MLLFFLGLAFAEVNSENNIEGKYIDYEGETRDYALNYSEFSPARNFNYGENKFSIGSETGLEIPLNHSKQIEVYLESSSLGLLESFSHVDLKFEKSLSDMSRLSIKPAVYGRRYPMNTGFGTGIGMAVDKELQKQQLLGLELNIMGNLSFDEADEANDYLLGNVLLRGSYQKLTADRQRMFGTSLALRSSVIDDEAVTLQAGALFGVEYLALKKSSARFSCRLEAGPVITQTASGFNLDFELVPTITWYKIVSD